MNSNEIWGLHAIIIKKNIPIEEAKKLAQDIIKDKIKKLEEKKDKLNLNIDKLTEDKNKIIETKNNMLQDKENLQKELNNMKTYYKVVDDNSVYNTDPQKNYIEVRHIPGAVYTDILITCLLDYGEPAGQQAFDNSTNFNGEFVFDELGLKTWNGSSDNLRLITHVIFHPVQKSLNRQIQIDYTLRIQTLSNINAV